MLRYIATMAWRPDEAQKVTDLYLRWKVPSGVKFILPPHTVLGGNRSIIIFECTDEALAKVDRYWRQVCCIEILPVMATDDLVKVKS
jgi:hypothetical protein